MTEKDIELLISALSVYREQQDKQAAREMKRGEAGKARRCEEEAKNAWKLMMALADHLCQPAAVVS